MIFLFVRSGLTSLSPAVVISLRWPLVALEYPAAGTRHDVTPRHMIQTQVRPVIVLFVIVREKSSKNEMNPPKKA